MKKQIHVPSSCELIRIAAPISLAILIPQVNFFTNTVFLGKLGMTELGANGITGVFYLILSMIGQGLSNGLQIQMARRSGEGNPKGLHELFLNGLLLALLFALGLMMVTLWFVPLVFSQTLHDLDNLSMCVNFIYIRVWGLPFLLLTQLINAYFIANERTQMLMWGSLAATTFNIVLDYALIFGHLGMPALGFNGAAVASVGAEIIYFLVMGALWMRHQRKRNHGFGYSLHFDNILALRTLRVSAPLIVQFLFSIGGWMIFFIFIEHLGKEALAASQVLRNVFGIVGVGTWALATTTNTVVSKAIGEGYQDTVPALIMRIAILSLGYTLIVSLVLLAFPDKYLSIYTADHGLIAYSLPSLRVLVVATFVMAISTVTFNGVVGTGNTVVNLTMEILSVGIYLWYCYWVIHVWRSPLYLCWGSELVYWLSLLVGSVLYLKTNRWRDKKV